MKLLVYEGWEHQMLEQMDVFGGTAGTFCKTGELLCSSNKELPRTSPPYAVPRREQVMSIAGVSSHDQAHLHASSHAKTCTSPRLASPR